uniref:TMEM9 family-containing protein n=1 Tax=Parastrongyloides trichosuri TaxID=131310 RepID=A0A0N4ZG79_PARTI
MRIFIKIIFLFVYLFIQQNTVEANFEDTRCRCVCPSVKNFATAVNETSEELKRRYYTKTNINAEICNPTNVVKNTISGIINESHIDAFLANCDCKYESRNTVLIKVVVIFVITVVILLTAYMAFLLFLDPMLKSKSYNIPYSQQRDESPTTDDNIFARPNLRSESPPTGLVNRPSGVIKRVEAEQNKWSRKVEEQRRTVFQNHTMLN